MTKKHKRVYDHIVAHWRQHGQTPTYRGLRDSMGISIGNVHAMVARLKSSGYLIDGQWGVIPVFRRIAP